MVVAAYFSHHYGFIDLQTVKAIKLLLRYFNIPVSIPSDITIDDILQAILYDKKRSTDYFTFILLEGIGSSFLKSDISINDIKLFFISYWSDLS